MSGLARCLSMAALLLLASAAPALAATTLGADGDDVLSVLYDPTSGSLGYDADGQDANSVSVTSATGIFTGAAPSFPANGIFNADDDDEIGTASFTGPLPDTWTFGDVADTNESAAFLLGDLTVTYSREGMSGEFESIRTRLRREAQPDKSSVRGKPRR